MLRIQEEVRVRGHTCVCVCHTGSVPDTTKTLATKAQGGATVVVVVVCVWLVCVVRVVLRVCVRAESVMRCVRNCVVLTTNVHGCGRKP